MKKETQPNKPSKAIFQEASCLLPVLGGHCEAGESNVLDQVCCTTAHQVEYSTTVQHLVVTMFPSPRTRKRKDMAATCQVTCLEEILRLEISG